jgi:hypothetical protein
VEMGASRRYGMFGGEGPLQRMNLRRARIQRACGTAHAHRRHRSRGGSCPVFPGPLIRVRRCHRSGLTTFPHMSHNFSTGFYHVVVTDPVSGCSVTMRHRRGKPSADQAGPASGTQPWTPHPRDDDDSRWRHEHSQR